MPHPAGVALAFAAALLCAAACQRFPKGGIEGTVRDHSGAPIANVHVGVVGLAHSGPSDASGRYRLARVPVGTHRLRATAVGYVPLERDSVVVRKGVTTRVDFTLDRMWPGLGLPSMSGSSRATTLATLKRSEGRWVSFDGYGVPMDRGGIQHGAKERRGLLLRREVRLSSGASPMWWATSAPVALAY